LEYDKALTLAKTVGLDAAKKEAQKDVLTALGISASGVANSEDISLFGSSIGDSVLLLTSIILQADRTTTEVSSLLNDLGNEIKSGTLSEATKIELASGIENINMDTVMIHILQSNPSAKPPTSGDVETTVENLVRNDENFEDKQIGGQIWMTANLNKPVSGSACYENAVGGNCVTYGRLYDWATAMALPDSCNNVSCSVNSLHQGICSAGWHIPSSDEWNTLMKVYDSQCVSGDCNAGDQLKSDKWDGRNSSGFSALPGGSGSLANNVYDFNDQGRIGYWWSSSEDGAKNALIRKMESNNDYVSRANQTKTNLFSVRCVKN